MDAADDEIDEELSAEMEEADEGRGGDVTTHKKIPTWEEAVNIALGVWLVVSPWALRFSDQVNVRLNAVIVGLVIALAIWAMALDPDFERWRHQKAAS